MIPKHHVHLVKCECRVDEEMFSNVAQTCTTVHWWLENHASHRLIIHHLVVPKTNHDVIGEDDEVVSEHRQVDQLSWWPQQQM